MKSKTKRNIEKVLLELIDSEVKEKRFDSREQGLKAVGYTIQKIFTNYKNRDDSRKQI